MNTVRAQIIAVEVVESKGRGVDVFGWRRLPIEEAQPHVTVTARSLAFAIPTKRVSSFDLFAASARARSPSRAGGVDDLSDLHAPWVCYPPRLVLGEQCHAACHPSVRRHHSLPAEPECGASRIPRFFYETRAYIACQPGVLSYRPRGLA
jgi:hypothetical protein